MSSNIYVLKENGEISLYGAYSVNPFEALRCAIIQLSKRYDTWNYHKVYVPIKESKHHLFCALHNGDTYYVKKPDTSL